MLRFGFVPEFIHFGKGQLIDMAALLVGFLLNVVEAGDKFAVGTFKGVVGAHVIETGGIDE